MSYGICRVQKMTAGSVRGIEIHDRREKDGISHTNKDIDWERSHLNYDLCPAGHRNFRAAIKERIQALNLPRAVRKDAIVMAQVLVTSDHSFFENMELGEIQNFFQDAYDFLAERYGSENIISATVHLDEKTPHMHFNFVPVTDELRLSAKRLLTPASLRDLQSEFWNVVGAPWGLERGQEGSKAAHLDTIEYKLSQKQKELEELKKTIEKYQNNVRVFESARGRIDNIRPQKGAFAGSVKNITLDQINFLKGYALDAVTLSYENAQLNAQLEKAKDKILNIRQKLYDSLDTERVLNNKIDKLRAAVSAYERFFSEQGIENPVMAQKRRESVLERDRDVPKL